MSAVSGSSRLRDVRRRGDLAVATLCHTTMAAAPMNDRRGAARTFDLVDTSDLQCVSTSFG
jgi:hypothetical protein